MLFEISFILLNSSSFKEKFTLSREIEFIFLKGESDMQQQYEQRFLLEITRLKNLAEARGRRDEYRYDSLRTTVS